MPSAPYDAPATPMDAAFLAPRLRDVDVRECRRLGGTPPLESLAAGVSLGNARTIHSQHGLPLAIYGVAPSASEGLGLPWMLTSRDLLGDRDARRAVLRRGPAAIQWMHGFYPELANFMLRENTKAARWVRLLGFTVVDTSDPDVLLFFKRLP